MELESGGMGEGSPDSGVPSVGQDGGSDLGVGQFDSQGNALQPGSAAPARPQGAGKVNLDESGDFQNWKSKMDKQVSERDKAIKQMEANYQNQLRQMNQQMVQMQKQVEQQVISGLDEYGQLEFKYKSEAQRREFLERQIEAQQQIESKSRFMQAIAEKYGVSPDELDDSHPMNAITAAADKIHARYLEQQQELEKLRKVAQARQYAMDDAPDLGHGEPVNPASDIQRLYNKAMLTKDGRTADRLVRQALQNGAKLDRHAWLKERNQPQQ